MKLKSKQGKFELSIVGENEDTAYLSLPAHPKKTVHGISARMARINEFIDLGDSLDVNIDFDKDGTPIGLEFLFYDEQS